ncbi:hypothetical protein [Oryza sativa Japonica Group]|uniref:Uncharacterized protein n=1 Tax=Oryza sativa subsp. japonica TaxID=39947 RepID=Q5JK21_ORYSJ|nr:hypothetical protein [Oryza sativa Japonica Group]
MSTCTDRDFHEIDTRYIAKKQCENFTICPSVEAGQVHVSLSDDPHQVSWSCSTAVTRHGWTAAGSVGMEGRKQLQLAGLHACRVDQLQERRSKLVP